MEELFTTWDETSEEFNELARDNMRSPRTQSLQLGSTFNSLSSPCSLSVDEPIIELIHLRITALMSQSLPQSPSASNQP